MARFRIEYRERPGGEWELYAQHEGTRESAVASALELRWQMREVEGLPRAAVRVDGRTVKSPQITQKGADRERQEPSVPSASSADPIGPAPVFDRRRRCVLAADELQGELF